MATLRNHPGFWMRDDAEASLARWEADHGRIGVNSAGRYEWEQQQLIDRWNQGGTYNRPPYLYEPKRPASASSHVANGGIAFDTSEYVRFRRTSADYGWWQPYDWDVVHFEYDPKRDKRRNKPASGSTSKPTPNPIIEEDDMPVIITNSAKNEWSLLDPDIGRDQPRFTGTAGNNFRSEKVTGGVVNTYRGFMVTTSKAVADAWGRSYCRAYGNAPQQRLGGDYKNAQVEASRLASEKHR